MVALNIICTSVSFFPLLSLSTEHLCKARQNQIDNMDPDEYQSRCNYDDLQRKANDDNLTLKDLLPCYRPQCTNDAFLTRQCSSNVDGWCWCSSPDGFAIEGTLQRNLPAGACGKLWPPGYGNAIPRSKYWNTFIAIHISLKTFLAYYCCNIYERSKQLWRCIMVNRWVGSYSSCIAITEKHF